MASEITSFEAFVAENVDGLTRTAYLLTWDLGEAEDVVQDCLVKVSSRWNRVGAMDQPLAYARRVMVNMVLDGAKRRARTRAELDRLPSQGRERRLEQGAEAPELAHLEDRANLVKALTEIAPRQRAVIVLRYFLDLSEADTAKALGCSVGTVKNTGSKALAHLRERFEPREPEAEACQQ